LRLGLQEAGVARSGARFVVAVDAGGCAAYCGRVAVVTISGGRNKTTIQATFYGFQLKQIDHRPHVLGLLLS
jgi:hypothetical protein